MTHFTSRNNLIDWLIKSIKRNRTLQRALTEGTIENLGVFEKVPPLDHTGLIVKAITSKGREFLISVTPVTLKNIGIYIIELVPWGYWIGDKAISEVFRGDKPEEYRELRNKVKNERSD